MLIIFIFFTHLNSSSFIRSKSTLISQINNLSVLFFLGNQNKNAGRKAPETPTSSLDNPIPAELLRRIFVCFFFFPWFNIIIQSLDNVVFITELNQVAINIDQIERDLCSRISFRDFFIWSNTAGLQCLPYVPTRVLFLLILSVPPIFPLPFFTLFSM